MLGDSKSFWESPPEPSSATGSLAVRRDSPQQRRRTSQALRGRDASPAGRRRSSSAQRRGSGAGRRGSTTSPGGNYRQKRRSSQVTANFAEADALAVMRRGSASSPTNGAYYQKRRSSQVSSADALAAARRDSSAGRRGSTAGRRGSAAGPGGEYFQKRRASQVASLPPASALAVLKGGRRRSLSKRVARRQARHTEGVGGAALQQQYEHLLRTLKVKLPWDEELVELESFEELEPVHARLGEGNLELLADLFAKHDTRRVGWLDERALRKVEPEVCKMNRKAAEALHAVRNTLVPGADTRFPFLRLALALVNDAPPQAAIESDKRPPREAAGAGGGRRPPGGRSVGLQARDWSRDDEGLESDRPPEAGSIAEEAIDLVASFCTNGSGSLSMLEFYKAMRHLDTKHSWNYASAHGLVAALFKLESAGTNRLDLRAVRALLTRLHTGDVQRLDAAGPAAARRPGTADARRRSVHSYEDAPYDINAAINRTNSADQLFGALYA